MDMRVAGALFGFVSGAAGYVIFRYWVIPIRTYKKLKARLESDIAFHERSISDGAWTPSGNKKRLKDTRKTAWDLVDCFNDELPSWYRILLKNRGETPQEAAGDLMVLSEVKEATHAQKRLEKAKIALRLANPPKGAN